MTLRDDEWERQELLRRVESSDEETHLSTMPILVLIEG